MKFATEKQLRKALIEENYSWLGQMFFNAFVTLSKGDPIREYHLRIWDSLTKKQQKACDESQ